MIEVVVREVAVYDYLSSHGIDVERIVHAYGY
jgi:hypothetical protein